MNLIPKFGGRTCNSVVIGDDKAYKFGGYYKSLNTDGDHKKPKVGKKSAKTLLLLHSKVQIVFKEMQLIIVIGREESPTYEGKLIFNSKNL